MRRTIRMASFCRSRILCWLASRVTSPRMWVNDAKCPRLYAMRSNAKRDTSVDAIAVYETHTVLWRLPERSRGDDMCRFFDVSLGKCDHGMHLQAWGPAIIKPLFFYNAQARIDLYRIRTCGSLQWHETMLERGTKDTQSMARYLMVPIPCST
jgi:hypothetical protein